MEGIRSYGRYYEIELDEGIGIKIDLNNANRNEYILMSLLGSGGTINPVGINLIYSHRRNNESYDFGDRLKLSDYKKFTIIDSKNFKLENSDGSVDTFKKIGAEYKNNELKLKARVFEDAYQEIYDIGLETKDGLEIDLNSEKRYPILISKDNIKTSYSYNGSNLLTKISNNSEDYFEFIRSGDKVIEIDQNKKGNIINRVFFTYSNDTISGIEIKNYNQETIRKYSFSISSNLIEIINLISGRRIKIKIVGNETTIESGYQETYEKKRTDTISYLSGRTTVSLSNGDKNYYFYESNNKIVSVIDGSNQVQITDYSGYKLKEISRKLNIDSTTCSSLVKNGDFNEYSTHWDTSGSVTFGNSNNLLSSLYKKKVILNSTGIISQTIAYKGTSLAINSVLWNNGHSFSADKYVNPKIEIMEKICMVE